jgi:hypothetical protein
MFIGGVWVRDSTVQFLFYFCLHDGGAKPNSKLCHPKGTQPGLTNTTARNFGAPLFPKMGNVQSFVV